MALNPFASVRGRQHAVVDGKTPELTIQQARALLGSLDRSHVVGLRDRAVLGVLTYTGARVGALARLRRGDLQDQETAGLAVCRKGRQAARDSGAPRSGRVDRRLPGSGRHRPVLQSRAPVFGGGKGGLGLTDRPMTAHGVRQMLKRRLHEAGLSEIITPHSFRVMVVTDLLGQNVPMEDVQYLVGHSNPQTTQIYDRRQGGGKGNALSEGR